MDLDVDLFTAPAAEVLASIADLEPGPLLMSVLLSIDPTCLDPTEAIDYVVLHERVTAWWASRQVGAVVAAAGGHPVVEELLVHVAGSDEQRRLRIEDAAREEIASALRWPLARTQDAIDTCRLLHGPMDCTREALSDGLITARHVSVIVEAAKRLPGASTVLRQPVDDDSPADRLERATFTAGVAELEARCLPIARRATVAATRRSAEQALLAIDAAGAARRRAAARRGANAYVVDEPDGMSALIARMATEQAHACLAAIESVATDARLPGAMGCDETASIGERRVAALRLLLHAHPSPDLPTARTAVELQVTIDLPTLLALAGLAGTATASDSACPATASDSACPTAASATAATARIRGAGPVSADAVRDLLADPTTSVTLRRLVTDPLTGHLLDYGRRTYLIPEALRRFIAARDGTCRFPGCRRRADRCQIDHAVAWDDGGGTGPPNLGTLCTRHHQLKTHGGWAITDSEASGACRWTSPHGRIYERAPVSPSAA